MPVCTHCGQMMHEDDVGAHVHDEVPPAGNPKRNRRVEYGDIIFAASKTAMVLFAPAFAVRPQLTFSLDSDGAQSVPYKQNVTASGFTIKFAQNYNGVVTWTAVR